jgi:two-component sensor histidine kinase
MPRNSARCHGTYRDRLDHRRAEPAAAFDLDRKRRLGGPRADPPSFGTRLIETLGRQLNGKVEMAYDLKGFVYALDIPLNSLKPPD